MVYDTSIFSHSIKLRISVGIALLTCKNLVDNLVYTDICGFHICLACLDVRISSEVITAIN